MPADAGLAKQIAEGDTSAELGPALVDYIVERWENERDQRLERYEDALETLLGEAYAAGATAALDEIAHPAHRAILTANVEDGLGGKCARDREVGAAQIKGLLCQAYETKQAEITREVVDCLASDPSASSAALAVAIRRALQAPNTSEREPDNAMQERLRGLSKRVGSTVEAPYEGLLRWFAARLRLRLATQPPVPWRAVAASAVLLCFLGFLASSVASFERADLSARSDVDLVTARLMVTGAECERILRTYTESSSAPAHLARVQSVCGDWSRGQSHLSESLERSRTSLDTAARLDAGVRLALGLLGVIGAILIIVFGKRRALA